MKKTKESISVTIPAYNEEETVGKVALQVLEETSKLTADYEILLVDDGSVDKTGQIMDSLAKKYPRRIRVVHHRRNKGFSGAMKTCYQNAQKELIFLGPADGQFNYREVKKFANAIKGKDFIVAHRTVNPEPFYRKFNSFFFHFLTRILFGIKFKEISTCIMYRKKVRDAIKIRANDRSSLFLPELIYKSLKKGYSFGEVPIHFYKRKEGKQKGTNLKMIVKTLKEMFSFWWQIKKGKVKV